MSDMVLIRFVKGNAPYRTGEEAGFPEEHAKRLVEGKLPVAVYVTPKEGYDEHGKKLKAEGLICGFAADDLDYSAEVREPVHDGGGMYAIAGVRVKGKKEAAKLLDALTALAPLEDPDPDPDPDGDDE